MNDHEDQDTRNTLFVAGGIALMVFGAGLVMAHPRVRQLVLGNLTPLLPTLGEPLRAGVNKVLPDVERYLKLRSM
jgi:hypothetical protein